MTNYKITPIALAVHRDTESPIFGDGTTTIKVDDESAGPFIILSQDGNTEMKFDFEEFDKIAEAVRMLHAAHEVPK